MRTDILVAKESAILEYNGAPVVIRKGVTRVRAGHPMLRGHEHLFEPLDVHYDIEEATAAPGERRRGRMSPRRDGEQGNGSR